MQGHTHPFTTVKPSKLDEMYAQAEAGVSPVAIKAVSEQQLDLMDFGLNEYQLGAAKTAIYPSRRALEYLSTGIAGEVGELCSKVAKTFRKDAALDAEETAHEIGDILWFCALLAKELGYDLADIGRMNLEKLRDRQERGVLKGNGDKR